MVKFWAVCACIYIYIYYIYLHFAAVAHYIYSLTYMRKKNVENDKAATEGIFGSYVRGLKIWNVNQNRKRNIIFFPP